MTFEDLLPIVRAMANYDSEDYQNDSGSFDRRCGFCLVDAAQEKYGYAFVEHTEDCPVTLARQFLIEYDRN